MAVKTTTLNVYLLAGVKTTTGSFNACKEKLEEQLTSEGIQPAIHVLYPYGDASRNWVRQVFEVKTDLSNRMKAGRIGGRNVWQQIKDNVTSDRTLLIGHSGVERQRIRQPKCWRKKVCCATFVSFRLVLRACQFIQDYRRRLVTFIPSIAWVR